MKLQFCVENPYTGALRLQPYMSEMMEYATVLDYCRFQIEDENGVLTISDFGDNVEVTLRAGKKKAGVVEIQ